MSIKRMLLEDPSVSEVDKIVTECNWKKAVHEIASKLNIDVGGLEENFEWKFGENLRKL